MNSHSSLISVPDLYTGKSCLSLAGVAADRVHEVMWQHVMAVWHSPILHGYNPDNACYKPGSLGLHHLAFCLDREFLTEVSVYSNVKSKKNVSLHLFFFFHKRKSDLLQCSPELDVNWLFSPAQWSTNLELTVSLWTIYEAKLCIKLWPFLPEGWGKGKVRGLLLLTIDIFPLQKDQMMSNS